MEELVARPVGRIWSVTSGKQPAGRSRRRLRDVVAIAGPS
jgi:hypothetical protein